jgi:hypothetical protein
MGGRRAEEGAVTHIAKSSDGNTHTLILVLDWAWGDRLNLSSGGHDDPKWLKWASPWFLLFFYNYFKFVVGESEWIGKEEEGYERGGRSQRWDEKTREWRNKAILKLKLTLPILTFTCQ